MVSHISAILPMLSDGRAEFSAVKESLARLELWVDKFWEWYLWRPLTLAHRVTIWFVLIKPTSLAGLVAVPSKAAVVGVWNNVLLHFCFGPEATVVAALSFRFGGMGDWWCNKQNEFWFGLLHLKYIIKYLERFTDFILLYLILNTVANLSNLPAMKYLQILFYFGAILNTVTTLSKHHKRNKFKL